MDERFAILESCPLLNPLGWHFSIKMHSIWRRLKCHSSDQRRTIWCSSHWTEMWVSPTGRICWHENVSFGSNTSFYWLFYLSTKQRQSCINATFPALTALWFIGRCFYRTGVRPNVVQTIYKIPFILMSNSSSSFCFGSSSAQMGS